LALARPYSKNLWVAESQSMLRSPFNHLVPSSNSSQANVFRILVDVVGSTKKVSTRKVLKTWSRDSLLPPRLARALSTL
jgi:hypothetical protein